MSDKSPSVFISYARADVRRVRAILERLRDAGIAVWQDQDKLIAGASYGAQIVRAIENAKVVVVVCSRHSFASQNVRNEVVTAWDRGARTYVPVWIERPSEIPTDLAYWLAGCQWVDASDASDESWFEKLTTAFTSMGVAQTLSQSTEPSPAEQNEELEGSRQSPTVQPDNRKRLPRILTTRDAAAAQRACAQEQGLHLEWTCGPLTFRLVPGGQFLMGAALSDRRANDDERPQQLVSVPRPLYVLKTPVTCGQIRRFSLELSSEHDWLPWLSDQNNSRDDLPAVELGLKHIDHFCRLVAAEYDLRLRLPTEAEWEYLARAGSPERFWWGDQFSAERVVCGCRQPERCCETRANEWGLCDVLGNIAEWTSSAFGPLDSGEAIRAATADSRESRHRVVRGGSFREHREDELRLSRRQRVAAEIAARYIGFRLVMDADDVPAPQ